MGTFIFIASNIKLLLKCTLYIIAIFIPYKLRLSSIYKIYWIYKSIMKVLTIALEYLSWVNLRHVSVEIRKFFIQCKFIFGNRLLKFLEQFINNHPFPFDFIPCQPLHLFKSLTYHLHHYLWRKYSRAYFLHQSPF